MMIFANRVGRLIEFRHIPPGEARDFDEAAATRVVELLAAVPRAIMCVDLRQTQVVPPHLADMLVAYMKRTQGHYEHAAYVSSLETPSLHLQVRKLSHQVVNPSRRTFTDPHAAIAWLDEMLNPEERARLRVFLLEEAASNT